MMWYEIASLVLFAGLSFITVFIAWAECLTRRKTVSEKKKAAVLYKEARPYQYDICDACGKYPKQPNSMLCKECEVKAYDNSDS